MSLARSEVDRLHELAAALLDDTIAPAEFDQLSQWLHRDIDARQFFVSYVDLHCLLRRYAVARGSDSAERVFQFPAATAALLTSVDRPSQPTAFDGTAPSKLQPAIPLTFSSFGVGLLLRPVPFVLAAAVVLVTAPLLAFGFWRASLNGVGSNPIVASKFVARLTAVRDVRWADEGAAPMSQSLLSEGQQLEVRDGFAEITFDAGPKLLLKGPAKFLIWSSQCGRLQAGELTAQIPSAAVGFRVESPGVDVVGLGAEFGLAVDSTGEAEVHVLDGEVAAIFNDAANEGTVRRVDLKKSEAVRFNTDAKTVERFVAARDRFRGMVTVDEPPAIGKLWIAEAGNWAEPANWASTTLPDTAGHMGIGNGGRAVVDSAVDVGTLSLGWMRGPSIPQPSGHAEIIAGGSLLVRLREAYVGVRRSDLLTTLKISGGTLRVNAGGYLLVGDEAGSKGRATIESGFLRLDEGDLRVGIQGGGEMEISGGVVSVGRLFRLAEETTSSGRLAIIGSAAKIDVGSDLIVGEKGPAELSFALDSNGVSPINVGQKTKIANGPGTAFLQVSVVDAAPQRNIVLINTRGEKRVGGNRFAGLPDESPITAEFNGQIWSWKLSYDYDSQTESDGSGNDVALKFVSLSRADENVDGLEKVERPQ